MSNQVTNFDNRKYVIGGVTCLIIFIYLLRLTYLQLVNNEYKEAANNNALFYKITYPARGTIFDREGRLLVYNEPTYDILFIPNEIHDLDTLEFCSSLGISKGEFDIKMKNIKDKKKNPGYSSYSMQTFTTQLTTEESSFFQEKLFKFPGFFMQNRTLRQYNYPNAGLLLGYVSELNKDQIDSDNFYSLGDYGGKSGIESRYEKQLRGVKGYDVLLRNARGRIQGSYEDGALDISAISGKNLKLSLDVELQAYGESLLKNKVGTIVMIEPSSGEILCMVVSPSYDPGLLRGRNFGKNFFELQKNPLKPLYNRATQGTYPPGSVFKISQGLTFLQEGAITPSTMFSCAKGYPPLGGKPACHPHGSPLNLEAAIATSCNSYFAYGLTAMLHNKKYGKVEDAFEVWKDHMVSLGFGYQLGVDLPSESRGFIPNSDYYTTHYGKNRWKASTIISISIGQGEVTATPLQIANLAAIIANKGHYFVPHIVKEVENSSLEDKYTTPQNANIDAAHFFPIIGGMAKAVTGGTCRKANLLPEIEVCGKTGTVQNPHGDDHSIFMGFAPKDKPTVAISVVIENGGFGATHAVPIGRLMLGKYLKETQNEMDEYYEKFIKEAVILPREYINWKKAQAR